MKNKIFKMFALAVVLFLGGCETFDLDQLEDPSRLPDNQLDPVYVFNYVQLTLPDFVDSANSFTQRVTRQMAMTGGNTYNNAFAPVNFDNNWTTGYLILNAIKTMEPRAQQNNQYYILGASKIMRCYILMTLTDMYGNIPYSEALQGNINPTPRYDDSADVYAGIYDELGEAVEMMINSATQVIEDKLQPRDLYYGDEDGKGDYTKWIRLANTLKLKMCNNARLVGSIGGRNVQTEITNLLAENMLITEPQYDFAFMYGTTRVNPNSRHPLYNDQYELGGGQYIGNYFMWAVTREKGQSANFDPREAFYFFKQSASLSTIYDLGPVQAQILPCRSSGQRPEHFDDLKYSSFYSSSIRAPFCVAGDVNGYLGRDHGDNSGIPADDEYRAVAGIYPAGGEIGAPVNVNSGTNAGLTGELGRGIMPMVLSSYVHFMKAEIKHELGIGSTSAREELEAAIDASITKVTTFIPMPSDAPSSTTINTQKAAYLNFVLNKYDTLSATQQLELIIKEYYIAAWGNGIEPYNNYRRTGYPSNFQPTIEQDSGDFFSTALYPGASVNNNPNAPSNIRTKRVFWDVAGLDLH